MWAKAQTFTTNLERLQFSSISRIVQIHRTRITKNASFSNMSEARPVRRKGKHRDKDNGNKIEKQGKEQLFRYIIRKS